MITLNAFKVNGSTILMTDDKKVKGIYPAHLTQPHKNKKSIISNCFKYNLNWITDLEIYDNGGETIDRITIVFTQFKTGSLYDCIGSSASGNGYFQHSNCNIGRHLGKKINFRDLEEDLQDRIKNYLMLIR